MSILVAGSILSFLPFVSQAATITVTPSTVIQGEPVMVMVNGGSVDANTGAQSATIQSGAVSGSKLRFFIYNDLPTAVYGVDLRARTGTTTATVRFTDGSVATASFMVTPRIYPSLFLAVPEQVGGNSPENQAHIVSVLQTENAKLAAIYSDVNNTIFTPDGANTFAFPVASSTQAPLVVTNGYGYNRESGVETITHKGTDFRAPPGTPVYAIADGIVRDVQRYTIYGNSIVVDHGLGILSMYMHLSETDVTEGQYVQKGQFIGYSGETGYSEGPHLHLSIKINGISIDPMKFFQLFGTQP